MPIPDSDNDNITIITEKTSTVVVYEPNTNVVVVNAPGPQGPPGNNKADIVLYIQNFPQPNEVLLEYTPSANQSISNTNSLADVRSGYAPTGNVYINLSLNNTVVGNINFHAGNTTGTMNFSSFNLTPSSYFVMTYCNASDATFGNIRITLSGTR